MNKKVIFIIVAIAILIGLIFFIKIYYKTFNSGNNINNNSSLEEVERYILNIKSYEAIADIKIDSNKNSNNYTVKQQYIKENNLYNQEIIEPSNISGVSFTYDGANLKIENKKLNLSKTYANYPYIGENNLSLGSFIKDYEDSEETNKKEKDGIVILETKIKNENKYTCYKKLYIDKNSNKITKLEIKDITQKTLVYISYNEIKINDLEKDDLVAFKLNFTNNDI